MNSTSLIVLIALFLIVIAVAIYLFVWPDYRLRRLYNAPFPAPWMDILKKRLVFFEKLPQATQIQLQNLIKGFINDKTFLGCNGQLIDDDIRVTVAAQACLLILNRNSNLYRNLKSILIYPSTFYATREIRDELGLVSTNYSAMLGESWSLGKVVLAWDNVEKSVLDWNDGHNVVLHEFAHQLDSESGSTNGAPILQTRSAYKNWAHVFSAEFTELQAAAVGNNASLIDHYGATNPAEFFAVATETFFELPAQMHQHHQELYKELQDFYQLDPASWNSNF